MFELITAVVMPFLVTGVAGSIKGLPVIAGAAWRVAAIRGVVAILSLIGAVLTQVAGGPAVDISMVETTLLTAVNGVAATAIYFFLMYKMPTKK